MSTRPTLEPDYTEPRLLTNARLALDVAPLIALHELASSFSLCAYSIGGHVEAQTNDEADARALARSLCVSGEDPTVDDHLDRDGGRHLSLSAGGVRVVCYQRKQVAA